MHMPFTRSPYTRCSSEDPHLLSLLTLIQGFLTTDKQVSYYPILRIFPSSPHSIPHLSLLYSTPHSSTLLTLPPLPPSHVSSLHPSLLHPLTLNHSSTPHQHALLILTLSFLTPGSFTPHSFTPHS